MHRSFIVVTVEVVIIGVHLTKLIARCAYVFGPPVWPATIKTRQKSEDVVPGHIRVERG